MKLIFLIWHVFLDFFYGIVPIRILQGNKREGFFFLANPRNTHDLYSNYEILKRINAPLFSWVRIHIWPFAVSRIYGLNSEKSGTIKGWFVGIFLTSEEILKNKLFAVRKIYQAIRLAENYGLSVIGLGGYTSSVVNIEEVNNRFDIIITSGSTYTALVSAESVEDIVLAHKKSLENIKIGIVGATGSVGRIIVRILLEKGANQIRILSKTLNNLARLHLELLEEYGDRNISYSTNLSDLIDFDLIILTTNAPSALIQSDHLKSGAIVYDISQPKNVSDIIVTSRPDCFFFEGGLVHLPASIKYKFNFKLKHGSIFGCMAETMIISASRFSKSMVKEGDDYYIDSLRNAGFKLGFKPYYHKLSSYGSVD